MGKRKRIRSHHLDEGSIKRQKTRNSNESDPVIKQAVLAQYYPQVLPLRQYLLSKLPKTSKIRKKKISFVGKRKDDSEDNRKVSEFLDRTLIGVSKCTDFSSNERWQHRSTFTQRGDDSISCTNSAAASVFSQSEIVDYSIWLLITKSREKYNKHLLCQGFRKDFTTYSAQEDVRSVFSEIASEYPNSHATSMKALPWPQILALLGKEGERAMVDLILDCGIFLAIEGCHGVYSQLSGQPLYDLPVLSNRSRDSLPLPLKPNPVAQKKEPRKLSDIIFVRNRMMYARAALNVQGGVRFGLRHIHVLNRFPFQGSCDSKSTKTDSPARSPLVEANTIHVMMYIFPRQFGMHNVFTDNVDRWQSVQAFQDYTLREEEINKKFPSSRPAKIPRRLRGKVISLVESLQRKHQRCSYKILLDHYCPVLIPKLEQTISTQQASTVSSTAFKTQIPTSSVAAMPVAADIVDIPVRKTPLLDHATPTTMVSAFCRAVFSHLIPSEIWGTGDTHDHNENVFYQNVDHFISFRRHEKLSLHEVTQRLKIADMDWLSPPNPVQTRLSQSDINKRWEILNELIYYLFDSILTPLIRTNFHVTESNVQKCRILYFRHDVWRAIAEPAFASLKVTMFEEVTNEDAQRMLDSRTLGFSQVRLVPKETGVRPIMNLKRKQMKKGYNKQLGMSINQILSPVFNVLTMEARSHPELLGSSMFSVGEMYGRLKYFKSKLPIASPLYFAKVDVKSAFDTIPQRAILELIPSLASEDEYRISKHTATKPGDNYRSDPAAKPVTKWKTLAHSSDYFDTFEECIQTELTAGEKNRIFVEQIMSRVYDKDDILKLLEEHIQRHIVKIGKKFYRQREGIPQGSVVSSLLCNYFYADLEIKHLNFLQDGESLLLRMIDDFLLITTNADHAKKFLQIMHDGLPAYGVHVNPDKTLANFEATINERKVTRIIGKTRFPYCGNLIDINTLNVIPDRERKERLAIVDSLTVEYSRTPGKMFQKRVLDCFKRQAQPMFLDTTFNTLSTVLSNVHSAFIESASKMYHYIHCLPMNKRPGVKLIIRTIEDLISLAFALIKSKERTRKSDRYKCVLSKMQIEWLALHAFQSVLLKRQSKFRQVVGWLEQEIGQLKGKNKAGVERLEELFSK